MAVPTECGFQMHGTPLSEQIILRILQEGPKTFESVLRLSHSMFPDELLKLLRQLLMTKFTGSLQEKDLSLGANCRGFGRIHHFRRIQDPNWIPNPLPTYPASAFLEVTPEEILLAQVYQLSVCNWRCWYCFVDFSLLSANRKYSDFVTSKELLTWMLSTRYVMLRRTIIQNEICGGGLY